MDRQIQLYEAISNIDKDIAANAINSAEKRKSKKPLRITLIAVAAAAAVSLVVGASMPRTKSYGKITEYYGVNKEDVVELFPTPQKFTVPDELPYYEEDGYRLGELETLDEVYETFGVTPIINDSFTFDENYSKPIQCYAYNYSDTDIPAYLMIEYHLYSKSLGDNIIIRTIYFPNIDFMETGNGGNSYENVELLTLNDGSQCLIKDNYTIFVYNGVEYNFFYYPTDKQYDNDGIKQVLSDLGVYDLGE